LPNAFDDLVGFIARDAGYNLAGANVHARRMRVHPAHPGKGMGFFQPAGTHSSSHDFSPWSSGLASPAIGGD
jgi:hypothetical protein